MDLVMLLLVNVVLFLVAPSASTDVRMDLAWCHQTLNRILVPNRRRLVRMATLVAKTGLVDKLSVTVKTSNAVLCA